MSRLMYGLLAVLLSFSSAAAGQVSIAPSGDDWDFEEDSTRKLTVAAVRYETGPSIVVQCSDQELVVALIGLPTMTGELHRFNATRADGATDAQVWRVGESGTVTRARWAAAPERRSKSAV